MAEAAAAKETTYTTRDGKKKQLVFKDCKVVAAKGVTRITLPEKMTPEEGIIWLQREIAHQEEKIAPNVRIPCYPFDGLVALSRAIAEVFGFVSMKPTPGFFGSEPPQMLHIPVGINETIEVPFGRMEMQGIDGFLEVGVGMSFDSRPAVIIGGEVRRRSYPLVNKIAEAVQDELKKGSIYKGKAILMGRRPDEKPPADRRRGELPGGLSEPPRFIPSSGMQPSQLVLNERIDRQVRDFLWAPIEHSQACRDAGVPLKRGILLAGGYGTGKSMTAALTADKAIYNGWTFIHLADSRALPMAIEIAKWYQPAVIFTEDIDTHISGDERNDYMNAVLNCVDGIEKNFEILVVLTTNNLERINRAFLRPGRLDAVIEFELPDASAAGRLIRQYGQGLIPNKEDVSRAADIIKGAPASMVRECVERAKLSAIARQGNAESLSGEDLMVAADGLKSHLRLLTAPKESISPAARMVGKAMVEAQATLAEVLVSSNGDGEEEDD